LLNRDLLLNRELLNRGPTVLKIFIRSPLIGVINHEVGKQQKHD